MKGLYLLGALATVGYAQQATLTTTDSAGRVLSTETVDFVPGERFKVKVDLDIAPRVLDTLSFTTTNYGVQSCDFWVVNKEAGHYAKIAQNVDMCAWPSHSFGKNFEGKMSLANEHVYAL